MVTTFAKASFFRFLPRVGMGLSPGVRRVALTRSMSTHSDDYFHYSRAVFGSVPKSLVSNALRAEEPEEPIDYGKAIGQHNNYVLQVKKVVPRTIQIPANEEFPDMVFVEDPAIVNGKRALMTKMGPKSRAGEVKLMRPVLEELGLEIMEIDDPDALIEGGDVVFTGREFLVGISKRTNKAGIEQLQKAFPEWPVTGITITPPVLHLSSMSSMCGIDTIAIGDSQSGRIAWKEIQTMSYYQKYNCLVFPDNNGANCLFINGTIFHPPEDEYPESYKIWQTVDRPRIELPNSELAKADGSLTCNSIRIP